MRTFLFFILFFGIANSAFCQSKGLEFIAAEEYENLPKAELYRAFLPAYVDIAEKMPPVGNQGVTSSCVAWSLVYAIRSYYSQTAFSPSFLYDDLVRGKCEEGLSFVKALTFMHETGAVPISEYPAKFDTCSPNSSSSSLVSTAQNFKIASWKALKPS